MMSAGTGITHSEYNRNKDGLVKFLQIWVFPNKKNVTPRYDQITLVKQDHKNALLQILSPNASDEGVWIYQDAWFHLGSFDKDFATEYSLKKEGNGIYIFVLSGNISVADQELNTRDGLGIVGADKIEIKADSNSEILLMEIPMTI